MKKGDIVLVPFPFTDLSGNKNRPALVLVNNESDITVVFISTQIHWKEESDILLHPNQINGLKKESLLRLSKIATLDKYLILGRLGEISENEIVDLNTRLKILFKI